MSVTDLSVLSAALMKANNDLYEHLGIRRGTAIDKELSISMGRAVVDLTKLDSWAEDTGMTKGESIKSFIGREYGEDAVTVVSNLL